MQHAPNVTEKSRNKKGKAAKPQSSFQFVNANPQSEAERRESRAIVRSNAINFHWRQVKHANVQASSAGSSLDRTQSGEGADAPPQLTRTQSAITEESDELDNTNDEAFHEFVGSRRVSLSGSQRSRSPLRESGIVTGVDYNPMNLIGVGQVDPFVVYPSELPKRVISPALAQTVQILPQLFPPENGRFQSSVANAWLQRCFSQRGLFHTLLFCQFARNCATNASIASTQSPELLACQAVAVREVNRRINDTSTACDDDNILAVLGLAFSGEVLTESPAKSPTQGPLNALQILDIYGGALDTVPVHVEGLARMISIRGGLANLKLPGLAQQISYGDIRSASRKLTKPLLPYFSINPGIEKALSAVRRPTHPLFDLGKGFLVLNQIFTSGKLTPLSSVLWCICDYTLAVDDYVEGRPEAQSLSMIADERNFVQHLLMSLTPDLDATEEDELPLYELCRLAATIYSLIFVFPLPVTTVPFAKLALQVKEQISTRTVHARWNEAPELMLWIVFMAAIASVSLNERSWYVSILDRLRGRLGIRSWHQMKGVLEEFFWFAATSDLDGFELWKEIERSNPFSV